MSDLSKEQINNPVAFEWAYWVQSKRLFAPPVQKNILLGLMNLPVRESPDFNLSDAMTCYNMAVNSQEPLDIAVWLIKTFNLKVYRSRKDAIYRLGFNNGAAFYKRAEAINSKINMFYNNNRTNLERSIRQSRAIQITHKNQLNS